MRFQRIVVWITSHARYFAQYTTRVPRWREKRAQDPARYWWQGISEERFDNARGAFVREAEAELNVTMFTFQEFRSKYHAAYVGDGNSQKPLGLLANALFGYTPLTRPVYFRLVTLWYACNATFLTIDEKAEVDAEFPKSEEQIASWHPIVEGAEAATDVYRAIHEYWSDFVRPRLSRCIKGPRETKA